jgi:hypothetical protein
VSHLKNFATSGLHWVVGFWKVLGGGREGREEGKEEEGGGGWRVEKGGGGRRRVEGGGGWRREEEGGGWRRKEDTSRHNSRNTTNSLQQALREQALNAQGLPSIIQKRIIHFKEGEGGGRRKEGGRGRGEREGEGDTSRQNSSNATNSIHQALREQALNAQGLPSIIQKRIIHFKLPKRLVNGVGPLLGLLDDLSGLPPCWVGGEDGVAGNEDPVLLVVGEGLGADADGVVDVLVREAEAPIFGEGKFGT